MYRLDQNGYTHEEVIRMLEGDRTVDFEFEVFDKNEVMIGLLSHASCQVSFDSTTEIMGTVNATYKYEPFLDGVAEWRLRPAMKILSPNGWLKYTLGVYIMATPSYSGDNDERHCQATGYDYSLILRDDKLVSRYYLASGSNYVQKIGQLIEDAGIQKINIAQSSLTTPSAMEWEIGTPKLTIVNELLSAINYEPLHFDRNGFAVSKKYEEPVNRAVEFFYQTNEKSLVSPGSSVVLDYFNKPNVFVRYTDSPDETELIATVTNDSVTSPLSTVSRGRRIVDVQSVQDIANQTTLNEYTRRVAIEGSQIYESATLNTALMPMHGYRDCIFVKHDTLGIGAQFIEYAWTMDLQLGANMSHTLKRIVKI